MRVSVGEVGGACQHGVHALLRRVEVRDLVPHVLALHLGRQREAARQRHARARGARPHDEGHGVAQVRPSGGHDARRGLVGVAVHAGHQVHRAALHHLEGVAVAVDGHEFEREARHAGDVLEQPRGGAGERARLRVGVRQRRAERVVGHPQRGGGREVGVLVLGEHGVLVGVDAEVAVVQQRGEAGVAQLEPVHGGGQVLLELGAVEREREVDGLGRELRDGAETRVAAQVGDGDGVQRALVQRIQEVVGLQVLHHVHVEAVVVCILCERPGVLAVLDHSHAHARERGEVLVGVAPIVQAHVERGVDAAHGLGREQHAVRALLGVVYGGEQVDLSVLQRLVGFGPSGEIHVLVRPVGVAPQLFQVVDVVAHELAGLVVGHVVAVFVVAHAHDTLAFRRVLVGEGGRSVGPGQCKQRRNECKQQKRQGHPDQVPVPRVFSSVCYGLLRSASTPSCVSLVRYHIYAGVEPRRRGRRMVRA